MKNLVHTLIQCLFFFNMIILWEKESQSIIWVINSLLVLHFDDFLNVFSYIYIKYKYKI